MVNICVVVHTIINLYFRLKHTYTVFLYQLLLYLGYILNLLRERNSILIHYVFSLAWDFLLQRFRDDIELNYKFFATKLLFLKFHFKTNKNTFPHGDIIQFLLYHTLRFKRTRNLRFNRICHCKKWPLSLTGETHYLRSKIMVGTAILLWRPFYFYLKRKIRWLRISKTH